MKPAARSALVRRLLMERQAIEATAVLRGAGIDSLVVKGVALAGQLYDAAETRTYADVDLLVDPVRWAAAQRVLTSIGYLAAPYSGLLGQPAHSCVLRRPDPALGSLELDLHHRIHGIGVSSRHFWEVATSEPVRIRVGDAELLTTPLPVTGLHLLVATLPELGGAGRNVSEWERFRARHPDTLPDVRRMARTLRARKAHDRALRIVDGLDLDLLPSPRRIKVTSWVDHVRYAPTMQLRMAMLRDVLWAR